MRRRPRGRRGRGVADRPRAARARAARSGSRERLLLAWLAFQTFRPVSLDDALFADHLVSFLKLVEYALLAVAVPLLVRRASDLTIVLGGVVLWSAVAVGRRAPAVLRREHLRRVERRLAAALVPRPPRPGRARGDQPRARGSSDRRRTARDTGAVALRRRARGGAARARSWPGRSPRPAGSRSASPRSGSRPAGGSGRVGRAGARARRDRRSPSQGA